MAKLWKSAADLHLFCTLTLIYKSLVCLQNADVTRVQGADKRCSSQAGRVTFSIYRFSALDHKSGFYQTQMKTPTSRRRRLQCTPPLVEASSLATYSVKLLHQQTAHRCRCTCCPAHSSFVDGLLQKEQDLTHRFTCQHLIEVGDVDEKRRMWPGVNLPSIWSSWRRLYTGGVFVCLCSDHSRRIRLRNSTRPLWSFHPCVSWTSKAEVRSQRSFIRWRLVGKSQL